MSLTIVEWIAAQRATRRVAALEPFKQAGGVEKVLTSGAFLTW